MRNHERSEQNIMTVGQLVEILKYVEREWGSDSPVFVKVNEVDCERIVDGRVCDDGTVVLIPYEE